MLGTKTIKITPEILACVCRIDEFKGKWAGLEEFTVGLSALGEVVKYGAGFKRVFDPLKERVITTDLVRIAHLPPKKGEKPVSYKTFSNKLEIMADGRMIGALEAAPYEQAGPLLEKLVAWVNESLESRTLHPLMTIAIFTAVFLQISPFATENMRTAKFLMLLLMFKAGYSYAPYVPLDKIFDERARDIYEALKHTQESLEEGKPDWNRWLLCFFALLQDQADVLNRRLDSKGVDTADMPALSTRVLTLFAHKDRLQMKEIVKMTNGRRSTLKLRLGELVDQGYLRRYGNARATWYSRI